MKKLLLLLTVMVLALSLTACTETAENACEDGYAFVDGECTEYVAPNPNACEEGFAYVDGECTEYVAPNPNACEDGEAFVDGECKTYVEPVVVPEIPEVVTMANLDEFLGRADVQYVDLRNFDDKMKSGYIAGFEMIPFFDYLEYENILVRHTGWDFAAVDILNSEALEGLFDMDKTIFLMCGSGTRAGYVMAALEELGYTNVINVGGISSYTGDNKVLGDGSYVLEPAPKGIFTPGVHVGVDEVGGYMVTVVVNSKGAIVEVVFDAMYHGTTKQALGADYAMRTNTDGYTWAEMADVLGDFVVANQGFGDMTFTYTAFDAGWNDMTVPSHIIETDVENSPDDVAGVTVGMEGFVYAWNNAMEVASGTGLVGLIDVEVTYEQWVAAHGAAYAYTPGTYVGVDEMGGYMTTVTVDADGFIVDVFFDAMYHGTTKQALGPDYAMRTNTDGYTWAEMANVLADFVVENQGFGDMTFTETAFDAGWNALTVPHHIIETDVDNSPDDVAGVTVGMEGFVFSWNNAISQASDSDLGVIPTAVTYEQWVAAHEAPYAYNDGVYYGYEGGYSAVITIEDGMIVSAFLDAQHCRDLDDPADGIKETCNTKRSYEVEEYAMNYVTNDNGTPLDDTDDFLELPEGKLDWWMMADKLGDAVVDAQTWSADWTMVVDGSHERFDQAVQAVIDDVAGVTVGVENWKAAVEEALTEATPVQ